MENARVFLGLDYSTKDQNSTEKVEKGGFSRPVRKKTNKKTSTQVKLII